MPIAIPTPIPFSGMGNIELVSCGYGGEAGENIRRTPFPVITAIHGYIDPQIYDTIDHTTRYADALTRAGFIVLHPNLYSFSPSENGPNMFRVGMAISVLSLIALVRQQTIIDQGKNHDQVPLAWSMICGIVLVR
jgi:hypothetical protein